MVLPTRVGDLIEGKYRVERVLGRGGMGVVVAARHLQLGQQVAIKFPLARMSLQSDVVARLVREGRAAMRVRSEHVARVYDVGTLPEGEPYLVMEYLAGKDLGAVVSEQGPLAIEVAVEYVLQAMEALAEAHALGIIHRDLKPSNLFLCRRADRSPLIKVIDFGISKNTNRGSEVTFTASAAIVGSPPYMAPEQMRSARELDARTDIWALGATLYCLLTGEPPFPGATIIEVHEKILLGAPSLRASCPDAPPALEAALARCMAREPAARYADTAELAEALAPLAPEHARVSALRVRRIVRAAADGSETVESDPLAKSSPDAKDPQLDAALKTVRPGDASWGDAEPDGATPTPALKVHRRVTVGLPTTGQPSPSSSNPSDAAARVDAEITSVPPPPLGASGQPASGLGVLTNRAAVTSIAELPTRPARTRFAVVAATSLVIVAGAAFSLSRTSSRGTETTAPAEQALTAKGAEQPTASASAIALTPSVEPASVAPSASAAEAPSAKPSAARSAAPPKSSVAPAPPPSVAPRAPQKQKRDPTRVFE